MSASHYIQTSTGRYSFGSRRNIVEIGAIAHSLAQLNRYVGHPVRPISVAEHSLLCVEIAERTIGLRDPAGLLAVLMHDAHESIVGDCSAPLKAYMRDLMSTRWTGTGIVSTFDHAEDEAAHELRNQLGLLTAFQAWRPEIHAADMHALSTERRDLLPPDDGPGWICCAGYPAVDWINLRDRDGMTWQDWRQAFIDRFEELTAARFARGEALLSATGGIAP